MVFLMGLKSIENQIPSKCQDSLPHLLKNRSLSLRQGIVRCKPGNGGRWHLIANAEVKEGE
jgi:hypothetical protein